MYSRKFIKLEDVKIPKICCNCGQQADVFIQYGQNRAVIPLIAITVLSWQNIDAPFCSEHALQFRLRFRMTQLFLWVLFLLGSAALFVLPYWTVCFDTDKNLTIVGKIILFVFAGSFAVAVFIMYWVKPRIYDLRIDSSGSGFIISAKSQLFIKKLEVECDPKP